MNIEELANAYKDAFTDAGLSGGVSSEREAQYRSVFGEFYDTWAADRPNPEDLPDMQLRSLHARILSANPALSKAAQSSLVLIARTFEPVTGVRILQNLPIIVLDLATPRFLWTMNKARFYGKDAGPYSRCAIAAKGLITYADCFHEIGRGLIKKGVVDAMVKSPPHPNLASMFFLTTTTSIQEAFLLAHEIAHIELGHVGLDPDSTIYNDGSIESGVPVHMLSGAIQDYMGRHVPMYNDSQEQDADSLALHITSNYLRQSSLAPIDLTLQCCFSSIFQMMTHFRSTDLVIQSYCPQVKLRWISRYYNMRQKMEMSYRQLTGQIPYFIVKEQEWLEDNMDCGQYRAMEVAAALHEYREAPSGV